VNPFTATGEPGERDSPIGDDESVVPREPKEPEEVMKLRHILLAAALLVPSASAFGGTLATPYLYLGGNDDQNVCIAVNVGKKPIEVTVDAVPISLDANQAQSDTCTLQPAGTTVDADNGTCEIAMNTAGLCRFTAAGSAAKLRKTLRGIILNRTFATLPPTIHAVVEAH
jgi:hypothetical protein